ncbi:unnamed protein product [Caenorhabditis brenneri]
MSSIPLSYDSLKHMLQHLEASKRIHLARRCPSIRAAEKRVPLQIDCLQLLRHGGVEINKRSFQMEFHQDPYNIRDVPLYIIGSGCYLGEGAYPPKYIFLKLSHFVGEQKIERIENYYQNKSYREALVFLLNMLFGGRNGPIYVRTFINSFWLKDFYPFSFAVKFRIRHLHIHMMPDPVWKNLEVLRRIIDEASFPLKSLMCCPYRLVDTIRLFEEIAEDVEVPKILFRPQHVALLTIISNPVAHFLDMRLTDDVLKALIEHWRSTNRPIGNEYTFTDERTLTPEIHSKMEDLREHFNGKTLDEGTIIIPMNAIAQIKVCYGVHSHFAPNENWALRVTVEAAES